jgi:hypothetical protein
MIKIFAGAAAANTEQLSHGLRKSKISHIENLRLAETLFMLEIILLVFMIIACVVV